MKAKEMAYEECNISSQSPNIIFFFVQVFNTIAKSLVHVANNTHIGRPCL